MTAITNVWRVPAQATPERHRDSTNALTDAIFNQGGRSMPGLRLPYLVMMPSPAPIYLDTGSAAAPSLTFYLEPGQNSGLYLVGDNQWRAVAGGQPAQEWQFNGTNAMALFADGSAAFPSIGFMNDTGLNTGFYHSAQDAIQASVAGTPNMIWRTVAGVPCVGLGADPSYPFHLQVTSTSWLMTLFQSNAGAPAHGLYVNLANTNSGNFAFYIQNGANNDFYIRADGVCGFRYKLGIGVGPSSFLHVLAAATDRLVSFEQTSTAAAAGTLLIRSAATIGGQGQLLYCESGGQPRFYIYNDGGVAMMGQGDMGAGTINVSAGIYRAGVAYTNPAYALEHWATGQIVEHADKEGAEGYARLSLDETERYIREHFELPGHLPSFDLFVGSEWLLEKVEELFTHVIELHARIKNLEEAAS